MKIIENVNNLIALAHIVHECTEEEFNKFIEDLKSLTLTYHGTISAPEWAELIDFINKEKIIIPYKIRKFNKEHKHIINIIKVYSNFLLFLPCMYDMNKYYKELNLTFNYIKEHKNEINRILELLEKLKSLNIGVVDLDETLTIEDFSINPPFLEDFFVPYYEKMELKEEKSGNIKCIVHDSNYYIEDCYGISYRIVLNNLFINPNSLPSEEQLTTWYNENQKIIEKINEKCNNLNDNPTLSDLNLNIKKINFLLEKLEQGYLNISNSTNTALSLLNNIKEDLIKFNDREKSTMNTLINNKDAEIASDIKKLLLK